MDVKRKLVGGEFGNFSAEEKRDSGKFHYDGTIRISFWKTRLTHRFVQMNWLAQHTRTSRSFIATLLRMPWVCLGDNNISESQNCQENKEQAAVGICG